MLKTPILHPQILAALGRAGHSSKILIADGNYPHHTKRGPNAEIVFLNFTAGMMNVTDVLSGLLNVVPVELVVGPSENFNPCCARCFSNSARLSTSNARCIKSGCTCTGVAPGGIWQISISSSLFGVWRNASWAPRGDVCWRESFNPSASW